MSLTTAQIGSISHGFKLVHYPPGANPPAKADRRRAKTLDVNGNPAPEVLSIASPDRVRAPSSVWDGLFDSMNLRS